MPRRSRIVLPGVTMHVVQRGNNRSSCFYSKEDYALYLRNLHELASAFGCSVHSYVLMTNHVHLLLTPARSDSTALLMKHLGQRHAQYVNRNYRRSGTLWEGRFRSCVVWEESYVLRCYRYIELNPVRAWMVRHPRDYDWSSYRCNGDGCHSQILVPHPLYQDLGQDEFARRAAYRSLFDDHLDGRGIDDIRQATNGNFALGSERFRQEIEAALGRRASRGRPGRPRSRKNEPPTQEEGDG